MVLVASGPFGSGNASGSLAGSTYSHNRFGQYVRNRTKPVNPNTGRQNAVRAALALLTDAWSHTLLQTDRDDWELYGKNVVMKNKIGEDITLPGMNHFIRSNIWPVFVGGPFIGAGPGIFELPAQDPDFAITASAAAQTISYAFNINRDWCAEPEGRLIKYMGMPANAQRKFFGGPWRYHGFIHKPNGELESPSVEGSPPWPFAVGQRIWCYGRIRRADGRLSAPFRADVLAS